MKNVVRGGHSLPKQSFQHEKRRRRAFLMQQDMFRGATGGRDSRRTRNTGSTHEGEYTARQSGLRHHIPRGAPVSA